MDGKGVTKPPYRRSYMVLETGHVRVGKEPVKAQLCVHDPTEKLVEQGSCCGEVFQIEYWGLFRGYSRCWSRFLGLFGYIG